MKMLTTVVILLLQTCACLAESVEVTSKAGTFIGFSEHVKYTLQGTDLAKQVAIYLGIPYAKPPVGNLRFSKPVAKEPLEIPYNASTFGNMCTPELSGFLPREFAYAEDCLFLNIYKPMDNLPAQSDGRPVLVFLHGGFHKGIYKDGGSNFYSGEVLAAFGDVIVVTLNYRLGLFGFFSTGNSVSPGNYGLWDQHFALKWVNENIAAFGGSPNKVTLVGQQTGAVCAIYQALYPGNKGLFQKVIAQSGSPTANSIEYAGPFIKKPGDTGVLYSFGCLIRDDPMECMRNFSYEKFNLLNRGFMGSMPHTPVFDGDFVRTDPKVMLDPANNEYRAVQDFFSSLTLMIGYNNMDGISQMQYQWRGALFVRNPVNWKIDPETFAIDKSMFEAAINISLEEFIYGRYDHIPDEVRERIISHYENTNAPTRQRNRLLQYSTDYFFMMPTVNLVELRKKMMLVLNPSSPGKTYLYKFSAQPGFKYRKFPTPNWATGATTGDELPFIFGFSQKLLDALNVSGSYVPSSKERTLAFQMMAIWSAFANDHDLEQLQDTGGIPLPRWPDGGYQDEHNMTYVELVYDMNESNTRRQNLAGENAPFWRSLQTFIDDTERKRKEALVSKSNIICSGLSYVEMLFIAFLCSAFISVN